MSHLLALFLAGCGGPSVTIYEVPEERNQVADEPGEIRSLEAGKAGLE